MKIVAKRKAFYKGAIIKIGEVLTIGNNVPIPTWAKRVSGKAEETEGEQIVITAPQQNTPQNPQPETPVTDAGEGKGEDKDETDKTEETEGDKDESAGDAATSVEVIPDDLKDKSDEELAEMLNKLLDAGCEKGIMLEDTENKTIVEQIKELQEKLGEVA